MYEAWAALNKTQYSLHLRERIERLDDLIDHKLANLRGNDLKRVRELAHIMGDIILREQNRQDLSLLNTGTGFETKEIVLQRVMTSLDSLIAISFDVGLISNGEINSDVKSGIVKGVNDAGIRIKEYPNMMAAMMAVLICCLRSSTM